MSNFAAMSFPISKLLSALSKGTSKIIDGFVETTYGFLEVCVESCIWMDDRCLGARTGLRERVWGMIGEKPYTAEQAGEGIEVWGDTPLDVLSDRGGRSCLRRAVLRRPGRPWLGSRRTQANPDHI